MFLAFSPFVSFYCNKICWFIEFQSPIPPEELAGKDQKIRDTDGGCRAQVCQG